MCTGLYGVYMYQGYRAGVCAWGCMGYICIGGMYRAGVCARGCMGYICIGGVCTVDWGICIEATMGYMPHGCRAGGGVGQRRAGA